MMKLNFLWLSLILFLPGAAFSQGAAKEKRNESQNTTDNLQKTSTDSEKQSRVVTEGVVLLRVAFLASGEVDDVAIVSGLTDELNRQAVEAARKIKFEPPKKDGVAYSVTKTIEYRFTMIYAEDDADLKEKAKITKKPAPDYPKGKEFERLGGKVNLTLELFPGGKIEVSEIKSDLPIEFQDKAREAALRIRFKPAIHKNGIAVTQIRKIEYEFKPKND